MRIMTSSQKSPGGATVAQVTFSDSGGFGAVGSAEYRGIPVFAPRGVTCRPCEGDNLLVLPVDGVDTCVGVLSVNDGGLAPGELALYSAGGASIRLKNSGEVVINGLTITKAGELIPAAGRGGG